MKALEAAIYTALHGSATLLTFVSNVYNTVAPSSATYPFLVFQKVSGVDSYTYKQHIATEYLYQVRIIGNDANKDKLMDAMTQVNALLTLQPLSVTGFRVDRVTRDGDIPDMAQDDNGTTLLQVGATYRFYVI